MNVIGTGDTLDMSSGTIYGANSDLFTVNGSGDTIENGTSSVTNIAGSNDTISYDGASSTVTVTGSSDTIGTANGVSHDTVSLSSGDKGDVINGSYDTLNAANQVSFALNGNDDTVKGSDDQISLSGQGDIIDVSHATVDVSGDDSVTINGSDDKIVGGNGDSITVTGTDDTVDVSDSSVTIDGTNTGDYVSGSGDTGSNWDDPTGSGGYIDPGAGYYGYGLTRWQNRDPGAAKIAAAEHSDSVYEGAKWADKTITWSFASAGNGFSDAISDVAERAAIEQAFQSWAKASGLNFDEVAAGNAADIEVGFSHLNPASTNEIGLTKYGKKKGVLTGTQAKLEDPNEAPLAANASGQLAYANTDATFEQVALHEIGHALGLADTDAAGSVMNAVLNADNQGLSTTDIANVQGLYANVSASSGAVSLSQVHRLVQAMSTFDAGEQGVDLSPMPETYLLKEPMLASRFSHAHAA
ncbi:matrixin family metalloprotease [Dyella choica]|uniref:Matrixin family metalloprotease n=1 Tax=Dyella choica TaxID=1927959 RepID=A0A3S0S7A8_9GAMM|nr:matrixin family metalloprotease [Dyella choica]RUL70416.1 matrixin family metalloprotease [Dyella choica]